MQIANTRQCNWSFPLVEAPLAESNSFSHSSCSGASSQTSFSFTSRCSSSLSWSNSRMLSEQLTVEVLDTEKNLSFKNSTFSRIIACKHFGSSIRDDYAPLRKNESTLSEAVATKRALPFRDIFLSVRCKRSIWVSSMNTYTKCEIQWLSDYVKFQFCQAQMHPCLLILSIAQSA